MKSISAFADDKKVDNRSIKLRQNYHDVLRRRITELRTFSKRCNEGQLAMAEIEDIHLRVRSLAGSGATYGYPSVSAAADPLDQALDSPTTIGLNNIAFMVDNLTATCEQALMVESNLPLFTTPASQPGSSRPVLLTIDDDPAIHDLVKAMLGDNNKIIPAYNGTEALNAIKQERPDLILLDNYMPGTEGLKLLEDLNSTEKQASPIIMLTADDNPREIMRAAEAGVADYVTKPFEPNVLAEKINTLIRRFQTTVLVTHNNSMVREMIAGKLRRAGLSVTEACDGEKALTEAVARMPDLILLDQSMPGMESKMVLKTLRGDKRTRHIPILYLAADRKGHQTLENLDTGATDHLGAFPPDKVAARIMDALGQESPWF